jgi:hypothetical protein
MTEIISDNNEKGLRDSDDSREAAGSEERVDIRCPRCLQKFRGVTPEMAAYIKNNLCAACQAGGGERESK